MYEQMAIDRISEVANLTDNLDDEAASWLIRWGIEKAPPLLAEMKDVDKAGAKLNELMAFMRKLNEIIPAITAKAPDDLADDLKALGKLYETAFDEANKISAKVLAKSAADLKEKSPLEAIQAILALIAPLPDEEADAKPTPRKPKK